MYFAHWCAAVFTLIITIVYYYPVCFYIFLFTLYSVILVLIAIAGTIYMHFVLSSKTKPQVSHKPLNVLYNATRSNVLESPAPIKSPSGLPLIFGKTVDLQLQQIIEYALRDFIFPWLGQIVISPKTLTNVIREDLWNGVNKIRERAMKIDAEKMIAVDMVNRITVHFEKIRTAEARTTESESGPKFATHSYLHSEEKELEFLSKLTEIMIILLMPRGYSIPPLKILICEVISYKIFFPVIKMITSPDYINQKIVQYIETKLAAAAIIRRSYEYAATFEEFLKVIQNSHTLEELSSIRTSIVNNIMHATTMQNLQRAKGLHLSGEANSLTRSELSDSIRLRRYIQQLTFAKTQCEKHMSKLGWCGHFSNDLNLSMVDILGTVVGRRYFTLYLEPYQASALVGFYSSVEELKHSSKSVWHQLGAEIFYTYIRAPLPEIKIDKTDRKKIETFLFGDSGPEVLFDIQQNVLRTLEEKYYPPFLISKEYQSLKDSMTSDDLKDISITSTIDSCDEQTNVLDGDCVMDLTNFSTYARNKLEQLQERLDNKNQALGALRSSVKPDSKILSILEKEVEWIKSEKRQVEAHLLRTELWGEHLGKWIATIQSIEIPDDKDVPKFMILVHFDDVMPSTKVASDEMEEGTVSSGWVVLRSLNQFHELHRKLRPLCSDIKNFDLPTTFKLFFAKNDKCSLEKVKSQIQKYLSFILENDYLNQSETVYAFLSPSSDHLKEVSPTPKKSKFSLSTLFKSDSAKTENFKTDPLWNLAAHREENDMATYLEASESESNVKMHSEIDAKDSIAEPLYALMGEVFDIIGVFKWVRKTLISFVQITYGRTINRQIRESITYLFEESMLHFYASTALKTIWPGGVLASFQPTVRSDDMKEMTANAAKALLSNNIPEVLSNLVGAQTAKHGILKVFDITQNKEYNKQLFYELLEILMLELFPEIRQLRPEPKPQTNSQ